MREALERVVRVARRHAVAVLYQAAVAAAVVEDSVDDAAGLATLDAGHGVEVASVVIAVAHRLAVGVGHMLDAPPTVVGEVGGESVGLGERGHGEGALAAAHVAHDIVVQARASAAVSDLGKPAGVVLHHLCCGCYIVIASH